MRINFLKFNISNVEKISGTSKTQQMTTISMPVLSDCVHINTIWYEAPQLLERIAGNFSKDDLLKIEKLKQEFCKKDKNDILKDFLEERKMFFEKFFQEFGKLTKKVGTKKLYAYNPNALSKPEQAGIKQSLIKINALKQANNKNTIRLNSTPYSEWFDTGLGIQNQHLANNRFEHPCDKVLKLTGDFNLEELAVIEDLEKEPKNQNIFNIMEKKLNILEKINKFFENKLSDFASNFSDKEFAQMKILAAKYTALNRCQVKQGYLSKNVEAVIYSKDNRFEKGNFIEGLGLIVDKINVDKKPTIIIFFKDGQRNGLKMYDIEALKAREAFLKNLPENISLNDLNHLNQKAQQLQNNDKNALIAEIYFETVNKNKIKQLIEISKEKEEEISKLINDSECSYFITSFRNHKKQKFPKAAKILSIKMLKLLNEKNAYPLFLRAAPYESKHSPVSLYIRAGFEPISANKEDVIQNMKIHKSEYVSETPLYMYAKDFAELNKHIYLFKNI